MNSVAHILLVWEEALLRLLTTKTFFADTREYNRTLPQNSYGSWK